MWLNDQKFCHGFEVKSSYVLVGVSQRESPQSCTKGAVGTRNYKCQVLFLSQNLFTKFPENFAIQYKGHCKVMREVLILSHPGDPLCGSVPDRKQKEKLRAHTSPENGVGSAQ